MPLLIPPSTHTVTVKAIDLTKINVPASNFIHPAPVVSGSKFLHNLPIYAFFIEHFSTTQGSTINRRILFDLGIRKDWEENAAPIVRTILKEPGIELVVEKDITDRLESEEIDPKSIDAVIWSHAHLDHTGDMSRFPPQVRLVVGPGTSRVTYPQDPNATLLESDFAGRTVEELDFNKSSLMIGDMPALDYFGDGSLYLLNAPGHCPGHIVALARVTSSSFVLLGGDSCHHLGQLRPTALLHQKFPCPSHIAEACNKTINPATIEDCEPEGAFDIHKRDKPLLSVPLGPSAYHDRESSLKTIEKLTKFDADPDVLVMVAHDTSLVGVIDVFPKDVNGWKAKGWKEKVIWSFADPNSKAFRFGSA